MSLVKGLEIAAFILITHKQGELKLALNIYINSLQVNNNFDSLDQQLFMFWPVIWIRNITLCVLNGAVN